jgi:hypothetical protein
MHGVAALKMRAYRAMWRTMINMGVAYGNRSAALNWHVENGIISSVHKYGGKGECCAAWRVGLWRAEILSSVSACRHRRLVIAVITGERY